MTTTTTGPAFVSVVVVSCSCGMFPLDKAMNATPWDAWMAASAHKALNPDKCSPSMWADKVPASLAP